MKWFLPSFAIVILSCGQEKQEIPGHTQVDPNMDFNTYVNAITDISIDSIEALAAIQQEPLIIYFSCYACVGARKLEDRLLNNETINPLLKDRKIIVMMVDDKTPLRKEEKYISAFTGDSILNKGQRGMDIEHTRFKSNAQPYFVKIDDHFNVLDSLIYQRDLQQAESFFAK